MEQIVLGGPKGRSPIFKRAEEIFREIYGVAVNRANYGQGITHFRGTPYPVKIPLVFGTVKLDVAGLAAFSDIQKRLIFSSNDTARVAFQHICDSYDLVKAAEEKIVLGNSALGREAYRNYNSAVTLACSSFNTADTFVLAFQFIETFVKAAMEEAGADETDLKKVRHNRSNLVKEILNIVGAQSATAVAGSIRNSVYEV